MFAYLLHTYVPTYLFDFFTSQNRALKNCAMSLLFSFLFISAPQNTQYSTVQHSCYPVLFQAKLSTLCSSLLPYTTAPNRGF
jgi:hypothetical protein